MIELRRHNASFCSSCFQHHVHEQVRRAVDEHGMLAAGDRVLVAVSGGKDSLALWEVLTDLGYEADGLYLGLGIGEYSDASRAVTERFAAERNLRLVTVDIPSEHGFDIPNGAATAKRTPCSACGLSKRHLFNRAALDGGYDVVATGHNLDDEAAVLFGNVLRWNVDYLARQLPVLPGAGGFVKKVKPLVKLGEREMAAYCVLRGIDYVVEECPMADGNRHIGFKEQLDVLERRSPGTKAAFYGGFLERAAAMFTEAARSAAPAAGGDGREGANGLLAPCTGCGSPTDSGSTCAFCRLVERATAPEGSASVGAPRRGRRR